MPLSYHIDSDAGLITLTGADLLSPDDMLASIERLLEEETFDPGLPQLLDLREVVFSGGGARADDPRVLTLLQRFNDLVTANIAVIIAGDLPKHELAAIYRATCQFSRAELFEDFDQAMRWLIRTEFVGAAIDA